jgi:signal transduction histidine kinase
MTNILTNDNKHDSFEVPRPQTSGVTLPEAVPAPPGRRKSAITRNGRLLIVEEDRRLRLARVRALSRIGYQVDDFATAEQAAEAAKKQSYALSVISVSEPGSLAMLLACFPPETGVLLVTEAEELLKTAECPGIGICSFLVKPFPVRKFVETVVRTVDRAQAVVEGLRSRILDDLERGNRLLPAVPEADQFLRLVVEISAAKTKADYVSLLVKDDRSGEFVVKAEQGTPNSVWNKIYPLYKEVVWLDERTTYPPGIDQAMANTGASALLCLPLEIKGEAVGAINHIKKGKGAMFSSDDADFAAMLGQRVAMELENARLPRALRKQRDHVKELLMELYHAGENERQRIAAEIHGGVAQWLVGADYEIQMCRTLIADARYSELEDSLVKIKETIRSGIQELRRAIANLRPQPLVQLGLIGALNQCLIRNDGIDCQFSVHGKPIKLSMLKEGTIYWAAQEMVTNVCKHASASKINLQLHYCDGTVSIRATDNGLGFNVDEVMKNSISLGRLGLFGMKERVELLGGSLVINSCVGEGTTVLLTLPVLT